MAGWTLALERPEGLDRSAPGGAVDVHARTTVFAPLLGSALRVGQVDEVLTGEEAAAYEGKLSFHPRLSLGWRTRAASIKNPRSCAYS
jgi:hypothetical protein